jgi:phi LC3 family holin
MSINWKVRIKNPVFWAQIAVAIVAQILAGLGLQWQDMTTWADFGDALLKAISSPVIVVSVIVSLWGIINDPTTKGFSDSTQALTYTEPKEEK